MSHPRKPRDVGNGLVCASFGQGGEWLSLATVDPEMGFVELTGLPLFDPELRDNAEAVLRYHSWMRREAHAFLHLEAGRATITTREDAPRGTRAVVQRVTVRATPRDRPPGIRLRVSGRLARPALVDVPPIGAPIDLPPIGPPPVAGDAGREAAGPADGGAPTDAAASTRWPSQLPPVGAKSRAKAREGTLRLAGDGAPVVIQAWLRQAGGPGRASAGHGAAQDRADRRLAWTVLRRRMPTAEAWVEWPADADEVHLDIACTFDQPPLQAPDWLTQGVQRSSPLAGAREAPTERRPLRVPSRLARAVGQLDQRAATYVRTCAALQVAAGQRCLLADHRILPRSVNAEAYWQARLLLETWARGGHDDDAAIVADHLRWLFLRCERLDGRWARAYLADGRPHDPVFRADQQLYPLLELADFVVATGRLPELPPDRSWAELAGEAWAAVESALDPATGLLPTGAPPAAPLPVGPPPAGALPAGPPPAGPPPAALPATEAGPAGQPAHRHIRAADQVLLWHTATRLAGVSRRLGLAAPALAERAARIRAAFEAQLVTDGPLGRQWAGSMDGQGPADLTIHATDLPLALAPLWGFCKTGDRAWRTTMAFAFDTANAAWVPGPAGGLGAPQLPGTWTLGDIFDWVAHGLMAEQGRADAALDRLLGVAFSDGMLPQAYDPQGSGDVVRHWFALPGALFGALVLGHAARVSDQSDSR